ncbi:hypothetical protein [Actinacidiphila glaucinigra]|uniref:hypothetical protein n=1 Tax=Actinacidiphila glaucinigra TaxID=235986 RepID=UPI0035E08952
MTEPQKPHLTPERRAALIANLRLRQHFVENADLDLKRHIARASEEGMSLGEIASVLGLKSPEAALRWRDEGERAGA